MTNSLCSLPNADQVRGIHIDYNGHGTSTNDVLVTLGALVPLVICLVLIFYLGYAYYSRSGPFKA